MSAPRRILACEDDVSILGLLLRILRREGYVVESATNGEEVLRRISTDTHYDVVLLDLVLPPPDGFALIEHFRRHRPDLLRRTIALSASLSGLKSPPEGIAAFVGKPFDIRQLADLIARVAVADEG